MVYDQLSADTLRLAQKATLDYVPLSGESEVQIGVFATDVGVRAVQRYTSDRAMVRRAVNGVLPSGRSDEERRGTFDRIDFVYYSASSAVTPVSSTCLDGGNSVDPWPSDHRAVLSTFALP